MTSTIHKLSELDKLVTIQVFRKFTLKPMSNSHHCRIMREYDNWHCSGSTTGPGEISEDDGVMYVMETEDDNLQGRDEHGLEGSIGGHVELLHLVELLFQAVAVILLSHLTLLSAW